MITKFAQALLGQRGMLHERTKFFQLSQEAVTSLAERFETPLLVLSLDQVEKNYDLLQAHIPQLKIHYAMKANPDLRILELLINKGSSFDVASDGEIRTLSQLGVAGDRMIYANPIKIDAGFKACADAGVTHMTFDSESESKRLPSIAREPRFSCGCASITPRPM